MYNLLGKNRFWILLFFLLLLVFSCIAYYFSQVRQEQCVAYIYQDGALIDAVDLAKVKEEQQILITAKNGGSNIVCIAPGKICVQEAPALTMYAYSRVGLMTVFILLYVCPTS